MFEAVCLGPKDWLRQRKKPSPWAESKPRIEPLRWKLRRYCGVLRISAGMSVSAMRIARVRGRTGLRGPVSSAAANGQGRNKYAVALVRRASPAAAPRKRASIGLWDSERHRAK